MRRGSNPSLPISEHASIALRCWITECRASKIVLVCRLETVFESTWPPWCDMQLHNSESSVLFDSVRVRSRTIRWRLSALEAQVGNNAFRPLIVKANPDAKFALAFKCGQISSRQKICFCSHICWKPHQARQHSGPEMKFQPTKTHTNLAHSVDIAM